MSRILIPRSDDASAKAVSASDWEKYFSSDVIEDYFVCGFTLSTQCPNILAVNIASGTARLKGLYLNNSVTCCVSCLTACSTNHIYAQVSRDTCCEPSSWSFTVNTTGTAPCCSIKLGTATTNCSTVTGTTDCRPTWNGIDGKSGDQLYTLSTCICDYCSPSATVGSSEKQACACVCDDLTTNNWSICGAGVSYDACGDELDFDADTNQSYGSYDLTGAALNSTKWTLRFKLRIDAYCSPSGNQMYMLFSLNNYANHANTTGDGITLWWRADGATQDINLSDWQCSTHDDQASDATFCHCPTAETLYVQMARTSSTAYEAELFSDACYTTSIEKETGTISACNTSLRYFNVQTWSCLGACNEINGAVDCVQFWDGKIPSDVDLIDDQAIDCCTCTLWQSNSECNPNIYFDMGSAKELAAIAVNLNRTCTTETEAEIRYSTDTCFTSCEVVRTLLISDFTDDTWRYVQVPRQSVNKRYFQIYGTGSSKVLSLNEVKYRSVCDWDREHYHVFLNPNLVTSNGEDSN